MSSVLVSFFRDCIQLDGHEGVQLVPDDAICPTRSLCRRVQAQQQQQQQEQEQRRRQQQQAVGEGPEMVQLLLEASSITTRLPRPMFRRSASADDSPFFDDNDIIHHHSCRCHGMAADGILYGNPPPPPQPVPAASPVMTASWPRPESPATVGTPIYCSGWNRNVRRTLRYEDVRGHGDDVVALKIHQRVKAGRVDDDDDDEEDGSADHHRWAAFAGAAAEDRSPNSVVTTTTTTAILHNDGVRRCSCTPSPSRSTIGSTRPAHIRHESDSALIIEPKRRLQPDMILCLPCLYPFTPD